MLDRPRALALALPLVLACAGRGPATPRERAPAAAETREEAPASPTTNAEVTATPAPSIPPPPVAGPIGSPHPIVVQAIDPAARWLVACQARADGDGDGAIGVGYGMHGELLGDPMRPYLIVGEGEGRALDALVTFRPDGNSLAIIEGGALRLLYASGQETALDTGDLRWDPRDGGRGLVVGFIGERHFAYYRGADPEKRAVVVQGLSDEVVIDPGPGRLLGARGEPGSPWIAMALDLPNPGGGYFGRRSTLSNRHRGPCRGPMTSSYSFGGDRPPSVFRVGHVNGWPLQEFRGLVGIVGDDAIVRRADRSLWRHPLASGRPSEIAEAACDPTIIAASAASGDLLIACRAAVDRGYAPLERRGPGGALDLGIDVEVGDADRWRGGDATLVHVFHRGGDAIVDLESGLVRRLEFARQTHNDGVVSWHKGHVLLRRERRISWVDLASGRERPLPGEIVDYPGFSARGSMVALDPLIVDLAGPTVIGRADRPILGVAASGHVLVSEAPPDPRVIGGVPQGPLRWVWPAPLE